MTLYSAVNAVFHDSSNSPLL